MVHDQKNHKLMTQLNQVWAFERFLVDDHNDLEETKKSHDEELDGQHVFEVQEDKGQYKSSVEKHQWVVEKLLVFFNKFFVCHWELSLEACFLQLVASIK